MTDDELKPCPFCGSDEVVVADLAGHESYCKDCHASGPIHPFDVSYETVKGLWNTRSQSSISDTVMLNYIEDYWYVSGVVKHEDGWYVPSISTTYPSFREAIGAAMEARG